MPIGGIVLVELLTKESVRLPGVSVPKQQQDPRRPDALTLIKKEPGLFLTGRNQKMVVVR